MQSVDEITPGRQLLDFRKKRIKLLLAIVKGKKGWRKAFFEEYPGFKTVDGHSLISSGFLGRTSNADLHAALEVWIPKIQQEKPDWFTKSETLPQS